MRLGDCARLRRCNVHPADLLSECPYIGLEHINKESLHLSSVGSSSDVTSTKQYFFSDDVLFGKLRPYFRKVAHPNFSGICSTDIWVFEALNAIDKRFLFYWLASWDFVNYVNSASEGTRMPRAKWDVAKTHEIQDFRLAEQKAIAHILGTLDDKIELNKKLNQTLEDIAKAIFKSWFVDFDPVRAKADGHPTGLPADISDLFPDELVNSEIGEIPRGWETSIIGDFGNVICGKTPSTKDSKNFGGIYPFITIPDMRGNIISLTTERTVSEEGAKLLKGKLLPSGSICISCIATPGLVSVTTSDSFTNQQINSIVPHKDKCRLPDDCERFC